jgi:DNA-binding CsgD family transcriptional regulator
LGRVMLLDRRNERAVLDALLEAVRAGHSGALVMRGDAGIGKTALLEYMLESTSGMRMVRAVGVESEMELAFAALHQLCAPMLDYLERLPAPQRSALAVTFGLSSDVVPDPFFVGVAVLSLLSEATEERPLVCLIDDAQWLDRASAQVLGFVARRLLAESVAMLFAAREPRDELRGLPQLVVEGLREDDARELLRSVIPGRLDEDVREQIVVETRGNPLALLELPRGRSAAQLAGGFGLLGAPGLSDRIEDSFVHRLNALPEDSQRLVLVAAADPVGDPALLWRVAERLGIKRHALAPAEDAGLVEVGGRVRFRHPLVRSAVYRAASPGGRREAHRALAEVTDAEADPDRRAWHLAAAGASPDESVAGELERAASRAQARGGLTAAAAFLDRAVALTPDQSRRTERALAAAQTKYEAGLLDDAVTLLTSADAGAADDLQRARMHLLSAQIAFASRRGSDAPPLLLSAARELEAVDVQLARATYLEALSAGLFAGRLARDGGLVEVSEAALAGPPPPDPPRPPDLLLQGLAVRFTRGYAAAAPVLKEALSAFRHETLLRPHEARWLWLAGFVASDLWDDETWTLLSSRQLELVRDAGALSAMPFVLSVRSAIHLSCGELEEAASLMAEMRSVIEATGIDPPPSSELRLAALRGREAELSKLIETSVTDAVARGEGLGVAVAELARATLYNGLGRYEAAMAAVSQAGEPSYQMGLTRAVAELIEAAVRCGNNQSAADALEWLAEMADASGTDWALGVEARSRALLSGGDVAESLYREAIERLRQTRVRVELARAHLLYGEWLRREGRRLDARDQLRTARERFLSMGIEAFSQRAERELLATGERVRKRSVETREQLTPQEAHVARLARDGLSNPEIGARLFISPRTVEYHLHKVFNKLGISSRNQLQTALPQESLTELAV